MIVASDIIHRARHDHATERSTGSREDTDCRIR